MVPINADMRSPQIVLTWIDCIFIHTDQSGKVHTLPDYQDGNAVLKTGVSYIDGTALPYAPEKEGLSFAGWYKDADLNEAWDFDSDTTSEALTPPD